MAEVAVVVLDQPAGETPAARAFLPLLLPLLLMLLVLLRHLGSSRGERSKVPPSPPALPLVGHAHLVGALPHVSLRDLAARHGGEDGLMMLRLGTVPTLVASSPRAAQLVLRAHDRSFASRPRSASGDVLMYGPSDIALAPYGEWWRQAKKLVSTHLLSANKVGLLINKIRGLAETRAALDLSKLLTNFMNDMVCRAVAGQSFRVEGREKNFYPGLAKLAGGVLVSPTRRKAKKVRDRWDELLDKLIDEHANEDGDEESDFIHVLLSVQEEFGLIRDNIKAILIDMLAAGTDNKYLVLEFAMAELMLHQDAMAKLQHEVRSVAQDHQNGIDEDSLTGMTYLRAVVKETLRLHPPSPFLLPHLSVEDCDVGTYTIPAGTTVLVNAWAIGRDPRLWDAAEEFMPERFVHGEDTEADDFRGNNLRFLPFGSGRRMCPGINFSLASIEILLANLVYHFDWELPEGQVNIDMTEVYGLTVRRKEKLVLTPRIRMTCCKH
ncbi:hypothetical protein C2845_PM15G05370 [Panicum miliaceum]|uniref:Indole-2-monooxygenase-like n=1 Tax=Panicum miliaceum TaxID=4540 RepID=A0A3L6QB85_PANMI|nr:hypothetical protein C2845_PM15G05370 [Panicum miliaceum]